MFATLFNVILWLLRLLLWSLLLLLALAVPASNYLIWRSRLSSQTKLTYISIFALLSLAILCLWQIRGAYQSDNIHRRFDPELIFHESSRLEQSRTGGATHYYDAAMGLDTCIDPEGNLIDLKLKFHSETHWTLLEIPEEFLRRESVQLILEKSGLAASTFVKSSSNADRSDQIKLEDFRFLDIYLKKQQLRHLQLNSKGIVFFDLEGVTEESFDVYIRTLEEFEKSLKRKLKVVFTTSNNALTHLNKSQYKAMFKVIRCYDRTKQTREYMASKIAEVQGLKDHYVSDAQAAQFIDKLDYDILAFREYVLHHSGYKVEGRPSLSQNLLANT